MLAGHLARALEQQIGRCNGGRALSLERIDAAELQENVGPDAVSAGFLGKQCEFDRAAGQVHQLADRARVNIGGIGIERLGLLALCFTGVALKVFGEVWNGGRGRASGFFRRDVLAFGPV